MVLHSIFFIYLFVCLHVLFIRSKFVISDNNELKTRMRVTADLMPCHMPENYTFSMKTCVQKLQVTVNILNRGQIVDNDHYIKIDKVHDRQFHEDVMLYEPVVIKVHQQPVSFIYPFFHQYNVNNKPYEMIITKDNLQGYLGCNDNTLPHLCAFKDPEKKGFCCPCSTDIYHTRGGQDCKNLETPDGLDDSYHASAHCLKFHPVWYSVHDLQNPYLEHNIKLHAYTINSLSDKWVSLNANLDILVGAQNVDVTDITNQVLVSYTGFSFSPELLPINHIRKYLLIPELNPEVPLDEDPLQMKGGPGEYLVLDKDLFSFSGDQCNAIGVSHSAFVNQNQSCLHSAQSCLHNQPMDYWLEDVENTILKQKGQYFLKNFGNLTADPIRMHSLTRQTFLAMKYLGEHKSQLRIEINADRILALHRGLHGQITSVTIAPKLNSTQFTVDIMNRGLVSSTFIVRLSHCTNDINISEEHVSHVQPQKSTPYILTLTESTLDKTDVHCSVFLLNHDRRIIAERHIRFIPGEMCICDGFCACKCLNEDMVCTQLAMDKYHLAGFRGPMPNLILPETGVNPAVFLACLLLVVLWFGIVKAVIGAAVSTRVARIGLGLISKSRKLQHYYEEELLYVPVMYDDEGEAIHPIRYKIKLQSHNLLYYLYLYLCFIIFSKERAWKLSRLQEVWLNVIFFFYLPFHPFHYLVHLVKHWWQKRETEKTSKVITPKNSHPELRIKAKIPVELTPFQALITKRLSPMDKDEVKKKYRKHLSQLRTEMSEERPDELETLAEKPATSNVNLLSSGSDTDGKTKDDKRRKRKKKSPPQSKSSSNSSLEQLIPTRRTRSSYDELNKIVEQKKLIYYNFTQPSAYLQGCGQTFSLCGCLRRAGAAYQFDLDINVLQIYKNVDGERTELEQTLPINPDDFLQTMAAEDVMRHVTLQPLYPCLNKVLLLR
ncbi:hapless 2-like [Tubulanus polymorphus]|uniref:hapless 2-like n=1 Tax=Tubulanus polymorphus TaxID=672921 RepID=UPI003DA57D4D